MALLKSKRAIFSPKMAILRSFWYLRDRKVIKNIVKWIKSKLLVNFIAAVQTKIFLESSKVILKSKMATFEQKMAY